MIVIMTEPTALPDGDTSPEAGSGHLLWRALFWVLLALAAAARLYGAWTHRYTTDPDAAVVALMAKHMAQGAPIPVFFYGQAYMGSLEPMVSALLCRLFGVSGFMVALGSALVSLAALPFIYLWARDAGGRKAGLAALAYCVIGPPAYYFFQFVPRGGYPMTLLFGSVMVWMAGRIAAGERQGAPAGLPAFFLLGLLGGLGWWTHQLIVFALVTAGGVLLVGWRGRWPGWRRLGAGLAGFGLGGLPLWLWNARHGWATFDMLRSGGGLHVRESLRVLVRTRLPQFLHLEDTPPAVRYGVLGLYALLLVAAVCAWVRTWRRGETTRAYATGAALGFLPVAAILFSLSRFAAFNTARYLVPLTAPVAVLVGVGSLCLAGTRCRAAGWLPLVALLAWQARILPELQLTARGLAQWHEEALQLGQALEKSATPAVFAPFRFYSLNFTLGERFFFSDLRHERVPSLARQFELSDRMAVLGNFGSAREFVGATGGALKTVCDTDYFGRLRMFRAPVRRWAAVGADAIAAMLDSDGQDVLETLTDGNLGTSVRFPPTQAGASRLEVRLKRPLPLTGLRVQSERGEPHPPAWRVWGQEQPDGPWEALTRHTLLSDYFWSGPRPYWRGVGYRMEIALPGRPLVGLRLVCTETLAGGRWSAGDIVLFTDGVERPPENEAWGALAELIRQRRIGRVYADRWVANRVFSHFHGRVWSPLDASVAPAGADDYDRVRFTPDTAVVVREEDAPITRLNLASSGVTMRETPVGPWVLLDFDGSANRNAECGGDVRLLRWTGCAVLKGGGKHEAARLIMQGMGRRQRDGQDAGALAGIETGVNMYAGFITVLPALPDWVDATGRTAAASRYREMYRRMGVPDVPTDIEFARGLGLKGISLEPRSVPPGGVLRVRYYWQCPADADPADLAVFVHFQGEGVRFQDDHVLLADHSPADIGEQPFPDEIFMEDRFLTVPDPVAPGACTVTLGLYDRVTHRRLKPRTRLPVERQAVLIPVELRILESSGGR